MFTHQGFTHMFANREEFLKAIMENLEALPNTWKINSKVYGCDSPYSSGIREYEWSESPYNIGE